MKKQLIIFTLFCILLAGIVIATPALENIYGVKNFVDGLQSNGATVAVFDANSKVPLANSYTPDLSGYVPFDANSHVADSAVYDKHTNLDANSIGLGVAKDPNYALKSSNLPLCINRNAIATTSTSGIELRNDTASTSGVPVQYSPSLNFTGSAWDTDGGGNTLWGWKFEAQPSSSAITSGIFKLLYNQNSGSDTAIMTFIRIPGVSSTANIAAALTVDSGISTTSSTVSQSTITTTSSLDGFVTYSNASSSAGTPVKMSPRLRFGGYVWNTTGAGSSESSNWIIENLPTSGTTPSSLLKFGYSANGGAYSYPVSFSNTGILSAGNIYPVTDDTYYIGKPDDDTPLAYKALTLKDTTNGKYYKIEVINGVITATDLTD